MLDTADVEIVTRGEIGERDVDHARRRLAHATRYLRDPILFARVKLTRSEDPANPRPALVRAMLDVNGRAVRAVADGPTMHEAIDVMHARLRRQLEHVTDRRLARRKRGVESVGAHEWRHGDRPTPRPPYFPRPPEDRRIVRRKSFPSAPLHAAEAAEQMALLDHDFHLFVDADTGRDAVVERVADGGLRLRLTPDGDHAGAHPPVPTRTAEAAARTLDLTGDAWHFYRDSHTGRGAVVYRRYDGHDGVITLD